MSGWTDPVTDPAWPRIVETTELEVFPDWETQVSAIDLDNYTRTAAQRGWGAGWPSCSGAAGRLATVTTARSGTRITVHQRLARLIALLLDWTEHPEGGNYLLKPAQCGGYNCRPITGTRTPSNHSWGLACDLNWVENPYTSTGRHTIPTSVARTWNRYGFAWGGDYTGAHDFMHLEFMGTPDEAQAMTTLAIQDIGRPGDSRPVLRLGATGDAVRELQTLLAITNDGYYGPLTVAAVRQFQAAHNLTVDGITGPATWAALKEDQMALPDADLRDMRDKIRSIHYELTSRFDLAGRPGADGDTMAGQQLSARVEQQRSAAREQGTATTLAAAVDALHGKIDTLTAAVAQLRAAHPNP